MKRPTFCASLALAAVSLLSSQVSANLFSNPGFEDPITYDGPPFVGSWEGFNGGAGSSSANSTVLPRTGAQSLRLAITNTDVTFAGAFQDVTGLVPGTTVAFTGYHVTTTSPLDLTNELRIEWRNSTAEVGRTPNLSPIPTSQYTPFSLTAVVPAGADTARVVYAIQTFSPEPTNNGIIYIDDVSFDVIPEPASLTLAAVAGVALLPRHRRPRR
jgi:hypothetical protein